MPRLLATDSFSYCVIVQGGAVDCRGANNRGTLGSGTSEAFSAVAHPVKALSAVVQVSGGETEGYCAVVASRGVECWGDNGSGQLGDGSNAPYSDVPVPVKGLWSSGEGMGGG